MKFIYLILITTLLFLTQITIAQDKNATTKKIQKSFDLINGQYVDSADMAHLTTVAIKAMLKELDPHSRYMSKKSLTRSQESIRGNFSGVGINYQILDDTLMVLKVVPNGPSEKAGLMTGDRLIKVGDSMVIGSHMKNSGFSKLLRGKKGSKVEVQVQRHKDKQLYTFQIERGAIPIKSVDAAFMLNEEVGYIKLRTFSQGTIKEILNEMLKLKSIGMQHLILDLRGNPGGLMMAAINLADEFLNKDKSIVYTEGLHYPKKDYMSKKTGSMKKGRVIVMVNETSASASEIVSGALQDNDRALIMGRRSYGKGLVGRNFYLPDGSGIRLTTGRYYTPSGRCIQKSYAKGEAAYHKDLAKRLSSGELFHPDSIHFPDSLKYTTTNGRTVYGGGGITPDIFLPLDTQDYVSDYYESLLRKGAINLFAGYYFDNHLEELQVKYYNYNAFKTTFTWTDQMQKDLMAFARKKFFIEPNEEGYAESSEYISTRFKAILARNLFTGGKYFEENSVLDKEIELALKTIQDKEAFKKRNIHHN